MVRTALKYINKDIFLMIRRKSITIFLDLKESSTVLELKKMVEGIIKVPPCDQQLVKDDTQTTTLEDDKTLLNYGFNSTIAKAQAPATIILAIRQDDGQFETPIVTPLSIPPELPDVMKSQDPTNANEQTASSSC